MILHCCPTSRQSPGVNYDSIPSDDKSFLSPAPNPPPSTFFLFSHLSTHNVHLLPAVLSFIVAGVIAPLMTYVVGQALPCGSFSLRSLMSSLWIGTAEQNLMVLRQTVYDAVLRKDIAWSVASDTTNNQTAAGLMATFAS